MCCGEALTTAQRLPPVIAVIAAPCKASIPLLDGRTRRLALRTSAHGVLPRLAQPAPSSHWSVLIRA